MIKKGDQVRHINEEIFKVKGILTVLEIKNGNAVCYIGDPYSSGNLETLKIEELQKINT